VENGMENNLIINYINILSMLDNTVCKNKTIVIKEGLITTIDESIINSS